MSALKPNSTASPGSLWGRLSKDPRLTARTALALLLAANLVAAAAVFRPWGGSPEELQRQLTQLRGEAREREATVGRLRKLVETVEKTRAESDQFFATYFLDGKTAYSAVLDELRALAERAGVKPKDHSFNAEPVEGSDTLAMVTITGNYDGSYADLVKFVNAIDHSPRFLTIERLQAAPQQSQGMLNISLRINVFVRGEVAQ
ncbi:MAG: type 4a pilus biogenesis protein PilO [Bryobacterales bacterium]|nr:type 4a pilus biogenesis protein PilO [Bryobacterales bacterium]